MVSLRWCSSYDIWCCVSFRDDTVSGGLKRSTISSTRSMSSHGTDDNGFNDPPNSKVSDPELRRQEHMFLAVHDQSSHCSSVMSSSPNQVESQCIIIDSNTFSPRFLTSWVASLWSNSRSATRMKWARIRPNCDSSTKCPGLEEQYLQQYFYHLGWWSLVDGERPSRQSAVFFLQTKRYLRCQLNHCSLSKKHLYRNAA